MTEIYFIRHTQAEGNLYKIMQGHWDGDVTELGLREIDALAERFRTVKTDAVYSSDLYRAVLTAEAVTKYSGGEVIKDRRFREINVGPLEGVYFGNVLHDMPENMKLFLREPWKWTFGDAETLEDVAERSVPAVKELVKKHEGQTIAIVSHGITIRCMLTELLHLPHEGEGMAPIVGNTSVSKVLYENGNFTVEYLNDMSHLDLLRLRDWIQRDVLRHESFDPDCVSDSADLSSSAGLTSNRDIYLSAYRNAWSFAHGGSMKGFDPEYAVQKAREHYCKDHNAVLRLFYENKPAGFVDLDPERGAHAGYGWISLLYLDPAFRSKGLGIQALSRAIMYFRRAGRKSIRLNVNAVNTAALKFYEKYGFEVLSTEPAASGAVYLMERPLCRIADRKNRYVPQHAIGRDPSAFQFNSGCRSDCVITPEPFENGGCCNVRK